MAFIKFIKRGCGLRKQVKQRGLDAYLQIGKELGEAVKNADDAVHEADRHTDEPRLLASQLEQVFSLLLSRPRFARPCKRSLRPFVCMLSS